MSDAQQYRLKVEEMLRLAAQATDLGERGRYIDRAIAWQRKADEADADAPSGEKGGR